LAVLIPQSHTRKREWHDTFLMKGFDKAPPDAIAAFLARPGGFFSGGSKAWKTAPGEHSMRLRYAPFCYGFCHGGYPAIALCIFISPLHAFA